MFSNKKNTHIKEGASAAHDLMETEAAGSSSGVVITNKKSFLHGLSSQFWPLSSSWRGSFLFSPEERRKTLWELLLMW